MATTMHSPKRTRLQTASTSSETEVLRALMQEVKELLQERQRDSERHQAEVQRLEQQLSQLSQTNLRGVNTESDLREGIVRERALNIKLKTDIFDGKGSFNEYMAQFNLIARANEWENSVKAVVLASNLRGEARAILGTLSNEEIQNFDYLVAKLQLRYSESNEAQNCYIQFTNRKQKFGESLAVLGIDLERLVRSAYPDCTSEARDRIACAQFISAIFNRNIKQTLQLEGVSSLRAAVERAKAIEVIQGNNFKRDRKFNFSQRNENFEKRFGESNRGDLKKKNIEEEKIIKKKKECWQCGSENHFRAECPSLVKDRKEN